YGSAAEQAIVASVKRFGANFYLVSTHQMDYREVGLDQNLISPRGLGGGDEVIAAVAERRDDIRLVPLRNRAAIDVLPRESKFDKKDVSEILLVFHSKQPLPIALVLGSGYGSKWRKTKVVIIIEIYEKI